MTTVYTIKLLQDEGQHRVLHLQQQAKDHFHERTNEIQSKVGGMSADQAQEFLDGECERLKNNFNENVDDFSDWVKSKRPIKPHRSAFQTQEEFETVWRT